MPSTKSPSDLQIGSGKVPNNTVTSSSLTSIPGSSAASTPPPINTVNVTIATALTRLGQYMIVLVDVTSGTYNITLPTTGQVGDLVTFVMTTTSTNIANIVRGGGDTIQGSANAHALTGAYSARSFVKATLTDWVVESELVTNQTVTSSTTLFRTGKDRVVLVDSSGGAVTVGLPSVAMPGDRITFVKSVTSTNTITLDGNLGDTIDGRLTTSMNSFRQALTIVRVGSTWITISETSSVIEITDTFTLSNIEAAKEIHVLVRTSDAAWIAGTKTLTLPSTTQSRSGQIVTVSDVDGNAESANITIASQILGTAPTGTSSFALTRNYAAVTLINKSSGNWNILDEDNGLVPNFFTLSRADSRADVSQSRFRALPEFNWSERRVALHAEFHGLPTNFLPVEGFTAGGTMSLGHVASGLGNVGVLLTTTTAGTAGYMHLGGRPTDDIVDPTQLLGFRAIVTPVTANPGSDYDVLIGFGDDISETAGSQDNKLGNNGLYVITGSTGFWRGVRQSAGVASGFDSTAAVVAGSRYVVEYYNDGTNWDLFINGSRTIGGSTNKPTARLNFGMQVLNGAGVSDYRVDVDSFTVFTLDMGSTRHNP